MQDPSASVPPPNASVSPAPSSPPASPKRSRRRPPRAEPGERGLIVTSYLLAIAIPVVGFILGIVVAARDTPASRFSGWRIIVCSVGAALLWVSVLRR